MTGFNSSKDITYNLSTSDLNEIVKMFLALNSCPSLLEKLYWKAIYGPKSRISIVVSKIYSTNNITMTKRHWTWSSGNKE